MQCMVGDNEIVINQSSNHKDQQRLEPEAAVAAADTVKLYLPFVNHTTVYTFLLLFFFGFGLWLRSSHWCAHLLVDKQTHIHTKEHKFIQNGRAGKTLPADSGSLNSICPCVGKRIGKLTQLDYLKQCSLSQPAPALTTCS